MLRSQAEFFYVMNKVLSIYFKNRLGLACLFLWMTLNVYFSVCTYHIIWHNSPVREGVFVKAVSSEGAVALALVEVSAVHGRQVLLVHVD